MFARRCRKPAASGLDSASSDESCSRHRSASDRSGGTDLCALDRGGNPAGGGAGGGGGGGDEDTDSSGGGELGGGGGGERDDVDNGMLGQS